MICKHLKGELLEFVDAAHLYDVKGGKLIQICHQEVGNIRHYEYHCSDCNRVFRYQSGLSIRQKWLKKIHEQLGVEVE